MKKICTLVIDYSSKGSLFLVKEMDLDLGQNSVEVSTISSHSSEIELIEGYGQMPYQPLRKMCLAGVSGLPDKKIVNEQLDNLAKNGWSVVEKYGFLDLPGYGRSILNRIAVGNKKPNYGSGSLGFNC